MKIAILGATGWIGSHILDEAKNRDHEVIALARNPDKLAEKGIEVRAFDLLDTNANLQKVIEGAEVLISSIGGRSAGNHDLVTTTTRRLLDELPATTVDRLLWVGGAGSLEVQAGIKLLSTEGFPDEFKDEAMVLSEALDIFRQTKSSVNWTFVTPAPDLYPAGKEGPYRVGSDEMLVDEHGVSRISVSDYAVAMIDELENAKYPNQRISVAY